MHDLGFRPFDADNHYYEAEDAFIRHIDPAMQKRCMQWAEVNGKKRLLVAGKINKFIPNPTFDPIAKPGLAWRTTSAASNEGGLDMKTMFGDLEPIAEHPGYRNRDARLALLDEQGMDGALLFPTLGVGMQEALKRDVPALHAAFRAFNDWLDEDWGFDRGDGRLYAAPMITLADADAGRRGGRPGARPRAPASSSPSPARCPTATATCHPATRSSTRCGRRIAEAGVPMALPRRAQRREPVRQVLAHERAGAAAAAASRPSSTRSSRWWPSPTAASPTPSPR